LATIVLLVAGCASKQIGPQTWAPASNAAPSAPIPAALDEAIHKAAAAPIEALPGKGWKTLFNGKTLAGWAATDFTGHGDVECRAGLMILYAGSSLTGMNYTNTTPKVNYEIAFEAMKLQGSDFLCGLTFPVKNTFCTLILGGWGGSVVGLSSLEGQDASENETTQFVNFTVGKWYRVRVRVMENKIAVWLDDKQIIDLNTSGRSIALRFGEIDLSKPLGVASYETTSALRGLMLREVSPTAQ